MTGSRGCAQCGTVFTPRREHARFCSAECRIRWNRDHLTDSVAEERALEWSLAGMRDITERLEACRPEDAAVAFSAVAEAVWWVTIIDARLIRQYMDIYDAVLDAHSATRRPMIEGTLAGLRFVRNQSSNEAFSASFISPPAGSNGHGSGVTAAWRWNSIPEPALSQLPDDIRSWEQDRYQAYQAWLADHVVADVFQRATGFLNLAAARVAAVASALAASDQRLSLPTGPQSISWILRLRHT
ncbi:MAG TPA: hypothetical protein VH089_11545 [Streptosporangiaceae bacterium]|nr:hypothetical protein [Streptosporangiaceae bacterium]